MRETDLNDPADTHPQAEPARQVPGADRSRTARVYYDSRVILDYLDHLAGGGRIVPREPEARFAALRLQALCDGILDACLLIVYEDRYRPADKRVQTWVDRQAEKVARGLAALEAAPPTAHAAAGCRADRARLRARLSRPALCRRPGARIYPRLVAWHDKFAAQVPAFGETKVGVSLIRASKSPGACSGALHLDAATPRSEPVIEAGAHDVGAEVRVRSRARDPPWPRST